MTCIISNKYKYISFGGGGHYLPYELGVIKALQEKEPDLYKNVKVAGVSTGAWIATFFILNLFM